MPRHTPRPPHTLCSIALLFLGLIQSIPGWNDLHAQCATEQTLDYIETPCGIAFLEGQSFTLTADAVLDSVILAVCDGADATLELRRYNGTGSDWNEGNLIATSTNSITASEPPGSCLTGSNGFTYYSERTFTFSGAAVEKDTLYVLVLSEGVSASGCTLDYPGGAAFSSSGIQTMEDLVFAIYACEANLTFGCMDSGACNYDPTATADDGNCVQPDAGYDCNGDCLVDTDGDGICDEFEVIGCTDPAACNYDPTATSDPSTCLTLDCQGVCGGPAYLDPDCGCVASIELAGLCNNCVDTVGTEVTAACGQGLLIGQSFTALSTGGLDSLHLILCMGVTAEVAIRKPATGGGAWNSGALLGTANETYTASGSASNCLTSSNGFTHYTDRSFTFSGVDLAADSSYVIELVQGVGAGGCFNTPYTGGQAFAMDGSDAGTDMVFQAYLCAAELTFGCTDAAACNYDATATADDGSCTYADNGYDCNGDCLSDSDGDGICDEFEVIGCTDPAACNYDATATSDPSTCLSLDCEGVCGGAAYLDPDCGCVASIDLAGLCNNCVDTVGTESTEPCGQGLLIGQTFEAISTGGLDSILLQVCSGTAVQVALRAGAAVGEAWNSGVLIGEADQTLPASGTAGDCLTSANGFNFYAPQVFTFTGVAIEAGNTYTIELLQGVAASGCPSSPYTGGQAFGMDGTGEDADLAFEVYNCVAELTFGCTDATACNYDATATADDGTCLQPDCHGDCGGTAELVDGCGCVGGNTGLTVSSCYGCTDTAACNYDSSASIDDGTCAYPDCNGECGGTAEITPCGCLGGSTGTPAANCIDGCITEDNGTDLEACSPALLYGQSFTVQTSGPLEQVSVRACCAIDAQIAIRIANSDPCAASQAWNAGDLVATSSVIPATCTGVSNCLTSSGLGGYELVSFAFDGVYLHAGTEYIIEFVSGVGAATCGSAYADGQAYEESNGLPDYDLAFAAYVCAGPLSACTNDEACNYDALATVDDGSCVYPAGCQSCSGEQDGTGTVIPGDIDGSGACLLPLLSESFDADDVSGYVLNGPFYSDGQYDYFGLRHPSCVSLNDFGAREKVLGLPNFTGSDATYLTGRDLDADGQLNPRILDFGNVILEGFTQYLTVSMDVAVSGTFDAADDDRILMEWSSDGVAYSTGFELDASALNALGAAFSAQEQTFAVSSSSVFIRLVLQTDGENDILAVDNLVVTAALDCTPTAVTASGTTVSLDANGDAVVDAGTVSAAIIGDCLNSPVVELSEDGTVWASSIDFDCSDIGNHDLHIRATDGTTSTASVTVTVNVVDDLPPAVTAVGLNSTSINNNTGSLSVTELGVTASDNCTASGDIQTTISTSTEGPFGVALNLDCSHIGSFTVFIRTEDSQGNAGPAHPHGMTVNAPSTPLAMGQDHALTLDVDGSATLLPATIDNGSLIPCGFSLSLSQSAFSCDDLGTQQVDLIVTDGNTSHSTTVNVTVSDVTTPDMMALSTASTELDASGAATLTAADILTWTAPADACTPDADLAFAVKLDGGSYAPSISFDCNDAGTTVQAYAQVSDAAGNTFLSGAVPVSIEDNTAPVISTIVNTTIILNETGGHTLNPILHAMATDNCTAVLDMTYEATTPTSPSFATSQALGCANVGAGTYFFRATDSQGNTSSSSSATLTVVDAHDPVALAANTTLYLNGGVAVLQADNGTFNQSSDACGFTSEVKLASDPESAFTSSLSFASTGTQQITLRVTDPSGNSSTDEATVTVEAEPIPGCMDVLACNYSASANTPDGSCAYPGEECSAPDAGSGFTWQINANGDGCDCTAQDFALLYFEDFGPGGAAGGQGIGYGYQGLESLDAEAGLDINTADDEPNWTLGLPDVDMGDGIPSLTGSAYWSTVLIPAGEGPADTTFEGKSLLAEHTWTSADIDVGDYAHLRVQADLTEQGDMLSGDYINLRLILDGTEQSTALDGLEITDAGLVDDTQHADQTQPVAAATAAVLVEASNSASTSRHSFDDVEVSAWGKLGCTDPDATNHDATAQINDGSCTYAFSVAYSRYDGGFAAALWGDSPCGGNCGTPPYLDAHALDALNPTSGTTTDYVVSSGTTITVDGTAEVPGNAELEDLFVHNLTIESGGTLVIPEGKRLCVLGQLTDLDGTAISGAGILRIDGSLNVTADGPDVVHVPHVELAADATMDIATDKALNISGDLVFEDGDGLTPANASPISGLVILSGSDAHITGDHARLDQLKVASAAGITVTDSLEIQGRLTLEDNASMDMGNNWLTFSSRPESGTGEEETTALLDAIPASADLHGPLDNGTVLPAQVIAQRYIAADTDGVTFTGYTLFASPIEGATVGDLANIDGFYLAGWPGTQWPNSFSTVLFWDEANSAFVEPTSNDQSLSAYGGAWIAIAGSQTPTMRTTGALHSHVVGESQTFALTRTGPDSDFEGWNLVYNPYQACLNWPDLIGHEGNAALIEDQYAVYDTQSKQFVRYSTSNPELNSAATVIQPGQSFWVRVKSGFESGSLTVTPSMIDNDATGAEFVRSSVDGETTVVLETENAFGATTTVLRFSEHGSETEFVHQDLSHIGSSSVRSGEMAFIADGSQYVAKSLPYTVSGDLHVRSRAQYETTMRVVTITGEPHFCASITDHTTGETLVLEEGEEIQFTLPQHQAEAGRFTLQGVPFAVTSGIAPECPDSDAGAIVVELDEVMADLTVIRTDDLTETAFLCQATGTVEIPSNPGDYLVLIAATGETSVCKAGRRQVTVFPGEEPDLIGLAPTIAECNVGSASLAFELYGSGAFNTALRMEDESIWEAQLPPGEHFIEDIEPGEYTLEVEHTCLDKSELVSLSDPNAQALELDYDPQVEWDGSGPVVLTAECVSCYVGLDAGYHWTVNGQPAGSNHELEAMVQTGGLHEVGIEAFSNGCANATSFAVTVGLSNKALEVATPFLGIQSGYAMVDLTQTWTGLKAEWFDAAGRLLSSEFLGDQFGVTPIAVPENAGLTILKIQDTSGQFLAWNIIL